MVLSEQKIAGFSEDEIIDEEVLKAITATKDTITRVRLSNALINKAREYHRVNEVKNLMNAYNRQAYDTRVDFETNSDGRLANTINNYLSIMKTEPMFDNVKFNVLSNAPEIWENGKMRVWTDTDDSVAKNMIENRYHIHNVEKYGDAFRIFLQMKAYHPIKDMIEAIEWDGKERIPMFLNKWLKVTDDAYTREVSRLIFAGGINRIYDPGCKFDDMVVLIGPHQGEGKSTIVRWLNMSDKFFSEVNDFNGKEGIEALEGAWICEVGELLALTRQKEVEAVKAYLTRQSDKYRMPYDRRTSEHPRQCIFIGTTNRKQFLVDKTGNRRFYPVIVHQDGRELYKLKELCQEDIRQCWAEAKAKYDMGKMSPYADISVSGVARKQQEDATEDDYREGMLADFLLSRNEVCIIQLWQEGLKYGEYSRPNKKDSNELSLMLQNAGFEKAEKQKRFDGYGVQRYWQRTEESMKEREIQEFNIKNFGQTY